MTPDEEKAMQAMFAAGDPAARLPAHLTTRVAARLSEARAPAWQPGPWARAVAVLALLASSAGLGGVAVWVTHQARKSTPPTATVTAPARAIATPHAAPDPVALEAGLLREALEALQRGDADQALAKLADRQRRFPSGALEAEAAVARARALLLARRDEEALQAFAALPQSELTVPLRLTWADLLVNRGHCALATRLLDGLEAAGEEARVAASLRARCANVP